MIKNFKKVACKQYMTLFLNDKMMSEQQPFENIIICLFSNTKLQASLK